MALIQTPYVLRQKTFPSPWSANDCVALQFKHTFTVNLEIADKLELGVLPGKCIVHDWWVLPEGLNGNATIGIMSGVVGDPDTGRTVGAQFFSAETLASALVRGALPTGFLLAATADHRSIGMTTSAQIVAGAAKKITLGLLVEPTPY